MNLSFKNGRTTVQFSIYISEKQVHMIQFNINCNHNSRTLRRTFDRGQATGEDLDLLPRHGRMVMSPVRRRIRGPVSAESSSMFSGTVVDLLSWSCTLWKLWHFRKLWGQDLFNLIKCYHTNMFHTIDILIIYRCFISGFWLMILMLPPIEFWWNFLYIIIIIYQNFIKFHTKWFNSY